MELTKEMKKCMVDHFTIVDGWALECQACRINNANEVTTVKGVCTVFLDCLKWIKEQKTEE
jgi:hypothetical protein